MIGTLYASYGRFALIVSRLPSTILLMYITRNPRLGASSRSKLTVVSHVLGCFSSGLSS